MKFSLRAAFCFALLPVIATSAWAQEEDAEGCKDSTVITRMQGAKINSCENKEYEQAKLPMGSDADGNAIEKTVEGDYHTWDYRNRDGVSEIQVFRNIESALKKAGFTIDYEQNPEYITAHKGSTWYSIDNKGDFYYQTVVTAKEMEQEINASDLSEQIKKTGHVAVYGIHFDTGKATLQADSEPVLQQIVDLLKQDPSLKLRVEGHTDNQGPAPANQTLSEKRATAVVAWLTAHGVPATRLTAKGFGASKPVADNGSEDGRARNRRVELVKQ